MSITSIGDMAQSLLLRSRSTQIKQTIATLTEELSSGQTSDITTRVGGDFSYLADIERNLTRLNGYSVATGEATLFAASTQSHLERLNNLTSDLSGSMISAGLSNWGAINDNIALQAESSLESAISVLNGSVGGRSLFSGTATDTAPLNSAETLLTELQIVLSGLGSATAIEQAAKDWFDDPAGFRATMYEGSDDSLSPLNVGQGQHVTMWLKADDPEFRDVLRNMAVTALLTDPGMNLDLATQKDLAFNSSEEMLASQDRITSLQADIGFAEARIEEASTRNASARVGLEYAKTAMLEADPFETATRLEDVQFQLEALYTVTVRTSNLSLLSFM